MARSPYVWDYEIDESTFQEILAGRMKIGRLDRDWAATRLLEYAPYREIVRMLGFPALIEGWPAWRSRIRSESRKRGFDFLAEWIPQRHPELLSSTENPITMNDSEDSLRYRLADYRDRITIEPGKRGGKPCIRGLRITVSDVLDYLASGMSEQQILEDFPDLTVEDIRACLAFAAER